MDSEFYWNNCDATQNAQEDWEQFVEEVRQIMTDDPNAGIRQIILITGASYEDVADACRKIYLDGHPRQQPTQYRMVCSNNLLK